MAPLLLLALLPFLAVSVAGDRAHGLADEAPAAISPAAYTFFHPNGLQPTTSNPCDSSHCSKLPLAATVQSETAHEGKGAGGGGHGLGAGGIAGISLSFMFVCIGAMGAYYVVVKRRTNLQRAQPEMA